MYWYWSVLVVCRPETVAIAKQPKIYLFFLLVVIVKQSFLRARIDFNVALLANKHLGGISWDT
jgi:hypothetical protein